MCNDSRLNGTTCKAELKKRLTAALAIVEMMPEDTFGPGEYANAQKLYEALDDIKLVIPNVRAWCSVKHYASHAKDPKDPWTPCVWRGYESEEAAREGAAKTEAHYKTQWETDGDRFKVEFRECSVSELLSGMRRDSP